MLYLGRRRNAYLVDLELAESEALLDQLWGFVDRPQFAWEHVSGGGRRRGAICLRFLSRR